MNGSKIIDDKSHRPGGASASGVRGSRIVARLYLILLSGIWFFVVCGFPDIFSENYRYGKPPDPPSWGYICLSLLLASPLLLGAISLTGRGFAAHFVRGLSVVALAVTLCVMFALLGDLWNVKCFFRWIAGNKPKDLVSVVVSIVFESLPELLLIALMILAAEDVRALIAYFRAKGGKEADSCTASK